MEPLRQNDLEYVAGRDVFLTLLDRREVVGLIEVRLEVDLFRAARNDIVVNLRLRRAKLVDNEVDGLDRLLVGRGDVGALLDVGVADDLDRVEDVVEKNDRVEEHEAHIRQAERTLRPVRQILDVAHDVVGEVADGSADERRFLLGQAGNGGGLRPADEPLELRNRIVGGILVDLLVVLILHDAFGALEHARRREAEQRVTADLLAARHALEQETIFLIAEAQHRRDGRERVGQQLTAHGNDGAGRRQLLELFERREVHLPPRYQSAAAGHIAKPPSTGITWPVI